MYTVKWSDKYHSNLARGGRGGKLQGGKPVFYCRQSFGYISCTLFCIKLCHLRESNIVANTNTNFTER